MREPDILPCRMRYHAGRQSGKNQKENTMEYKWAAGSDVGIRKKVNQDSLLLESKIMKNGNGDKKYIILAVVGDGVGGLSEGEWASAAAVRLMQSWARDMLPELFVRGKLQVSSMKASLNNVLRDINRKIIDRSEDASSGTTLCGIIIVDDHFYTINVGDSRAYRIRGGSAERLTKDQTVLQEDLDSGAITPDRIKEHPHPHMLTHCIGTEASVSMVYTEGGILPGDVFIVCSDGFYGTMTDDDLALHLSPELLRSKEDISNQIGYCISEVKRRKEKDNISVIVLKAEG